MNFDRLLSSATTVPENPWNGFPEYNFVGGHIDRATVPVDDLLAAVSTGMQKTGKELASYGLLSGPQGYLPLREYLVTKLQRYSQVMCSAEEILLTSGSLQGMDLVNKALLDAGDSVIVEESNYGGALSRFNKLGVAMEAIPVDEDGMQIDVLEKALATMANEQRLPKFIYTIPTVHNPTGSILTLKRRKAMLALAARYDVAIVEDECYADLVWDGQRPAALYGLDTDARVIHIGTFSKTISPALRVGYVVAPWPMMGHILALKSDAGSGALEQLLLAEYCPEHFDQHVASNNQVLKRKLDTLTGALDREFGSTAEYWYPPGGIFLWVKFDKAVDTQKLAAVAGSEGVSINPGHEWSLQGDSKSFIRLCFAYPEEKTIEAGIARLAEICHDTFGVPEYGANRKR